MGNTDHGGLRHTGATDRQIFDVDRTDPFAPGLDHVLGAIRELDAVVLVHYGEIAGVEPSILQQRLLVAVIAADDPGTAHHETAARLAVARQFMAVLIGDFDVDTV